jgi:hypothetical protein
MSGLSDTLGSSWPPVAIRTCVDPFSLQPTSPNHKMEEDDKKKKKDNEKLWFSNQYVHCSHCPPCLDKECLKHDESRKRCIAATRCRDLQRHTHSAHGVKTKPRAVERPRSVMDMIRQPRLTLSTRPSSVPVPPSIPAPEPLFDASR